MTSKLLRGASALALVLALTAPSFAQVGNNVRGAAKGGAGGGSGDFAGPASSTADDFVQFSGTGGKTGKDGGYGPASFAPAGAVSIVTTSQSVQAAAVSACKLYIADAASLNFTFDAVSTLGSNASNGCVEIATKANPATVTANAADVIDYAGTVTGSGGNVTIPAYTLVRITFSTTKLTISGPSAQGTAAKNMRATGSFTSGNVVVTDNNGNAIDGGSAPGGGSGGVPSAYVAGAWMWAAPLGSAYSGTNANTGIGTIVFYPFVVTGTITISDLGLHVLTLFSGGKAQVGIYANSTSWIGPNGAVLMNSGDISTTTATPANAAVTGSPQLTPGVYWVGTNFDNTTAKVKGFNNNNPSIDIIAGADTFSHLSANSTATGTKITVTSTYGTWPTFANNSSFSYAAATDIPVAAMKIGSVP